MKLEQFIAESAGDAVEQIRGQLGPDAVVVNVRQLPRSFWQKPRIEVLAYAPEPAAAPPAPVEEAPAPAPASADPVAPEPAGNRRDVAAVLESLGLLPLHAARVAEQLQAGEDADLTLPLTEELAQARSLLSRWWRPAGRASAARLHVFVGAPGVGKTTALCKWLTNAVLLEGRTAHVWRLDGRAANTAESLSVHGEILGVPVERAWSGAPIIEDMAFIDLPGVPWTDPAAVQELAQQVAQYPDAAVHLVLNAAYESGQLLAQVRAFEDLPLSDLIVTHLDEEMRWGKLWNLVLGTNYPIRFLAAGQNIPGTFAEASAEHLLARLFPLK